MFQKTILKLTASFAEKKLCNVQNLKIVFMIISMTLEQRHFELNNLRVLSEIKTC